LPHGLREKITLRMQGAEYEVELWIKATFGEVPERQRRCWETLVRMVRDRDEARARRRSVGP